VQKGRHDLVVAFLVETAGLHASLSAYRIAPAAVPYGELSRPRRNSLLVYNELVRGLPHVPPIQPSGAFQRMANVAGLPALGRSGRLCGLRWDLHSGVSS
jgi:hypothetical protein